MDRTPRRLVIDARPRGPRGPLAVEQVRGRTVLDRLFDLAEGLSERTVPVHVDPDDDEHAALSDAIARRGRGRFSTAEGPPAEGHAVLRTDRLYDAPRLRRALRRGGDPETAVIWRLDRPNALESAGDELIRRQSYQPIGRYWALEPARSLARVLAPTRVRPNAVTVAAAALMLAASGLIASARASVGVNLAAGVLLAAALVLDTADGHLARLQGTASAFGRWLDAWLDELCDMALHAAIAWSAFTRTGEAAWLAVGMFYAMSKYVFLVGNVETPEGEKSVREGSADVVRSPLRDLIRLAGHADVRWHLWIVLAAVGRLDAALAGYALYFATRTTLGAAGKAARHA